MKTKICSTCKTKKSVSEFWRNKCQKDGLHSYCKKCGCELNKNRHKKKHLQELPPNMSICYKCGKLKPINQFYNDKHRKDGKQYRCEKCCKKYYQENKEQAKINNKKWKEKNPNYNKEYRRNNKSKMNGYRKRQISKNPIFKFSANVRNLIYGSFKRCGYGKNSNTQDILGCSFDFLQQYISSQFQKGMTLKNYGKWHIDHITPLSTAKTEEDVIKLCHYSNLQPLWAKDNIMKANKIL